MLKKTKIFLVFALALVMCYASIPSAMAAPGNATETSQAAIAKVLKVPYGTAIPANMTFKFEIAAQSLNGDNSNDSKAKAMAGLDTTVVVNGVASIIFDGNATKQIDKGTVAGITTWNYESAGLFVATQFPHAGIYEYTITETPDTYIIADPLHEATVYSQAKYIVKVYVKDSASGLVITHIGAVKIVDDDGKDIPDSEQTKVDPTPGKSEMAFTNKYEKTNGPTKPEEPDPTKSTLDISKIVTGQFGSSTTYFNFSLTITLPGLIDKYLKPYYTAFVVEKGIIVDPTKNVAATSTSLIGTTAGGLKYIRFDRVGTSLIASANFLLKDGQTLMFTDTPVGTSYTLTETGEVGYKTSAEVTWNGSSPATKVSEGDLAAGIVLPSNNNIDIMMLYVGEAANRAVITNDAGDITPTGLDLNDLPFIGLIVLALISLVAFIVVKSRKKAKDTQF